MESISFEYTKVRKEFGVQPRFSDTKADLNSIVSIQPDPAAAKQWVQRSTTTVELSCTPQMAQHECNTARIETKERGLNHTDGAWPDGATEFVERQRIVRRIKNDTQYQSAVVGLVATVEDVIKENNQIDLYEEYFQEEEGETHDVDPPNSKTLAVLRDPKFDSGAACKRTVTKIRWHPDNTHKMAVAYAVPEFQKADDRMSMSSFIWDVNRPNKFFQELTPQSSLTALAFNPKTPDHLLGGCYNGLINFWDLRKGKAPTAKSQLEHSHHDPVYDVQWIRTKTGQDFVSVGTDGQLLWWDARQMENGPVDRMPMQSSNDVSFGGSALEYRSDAGATRYLVGSEQGCALLVERKPNKDGDSQKSLKAIYGEQVGRHHGPIYSVSRNPVVTKFFLTVGDWTARLWHEDVAWGPLMTTPYDASFLTHGCWSPTRPGVFFTTKMDGTMDVWDLHYKHNEATFSVKVGESSLSCLTPHNDGKLIAVGDAEGTCHVLSLSSSLSEKAENEKDIVQAMLERETQREKNLSLMRAQRKNKNREKAAAAPEDDEDDPAVIKTVTDAFYQKLDMVPGGGAAAAAGPGGDTADGAQPQQEPAPAAAAAEAAAEAQQPAAAYGPGDGDVNEL
jgi:dynein intermediate chain 2